MQSWNIVKGGLKRMHGVWAIVKDEEHSKDKGAYSRARGMLKSMAHIKS